MGDEVTIWQQLSAPLPKDEIKLRVGSVTKHNGQSQQTPYADGTKAMLLAYHDARHVMERLDEVVGPENWQDTYRELPNFAVECTLSIRVDGEWISKTDVGYPNNPKKPEDEALKSSYSDGLKRAGVKWGVGRYLYNLPESGWWPVDKWGKLSAQDEGKIRGRMFDALAIDAPPPPDPDEKPEALPWPDRILKMAKENGTGTMLRKHLGLDAKAKTGDYKDALADLDDDKRGAVELIASGLAEEVSS